MSADDLWQQLRYENETFEVQVYPGDEETKGASYVLLEDVQV